LREHCGLGTSQRRLLRRAVARFTLSARGFDRVRRVARTIADLAGASSVQTAHLAEAVEFRGQAGR
jgi:magnesium chelatase family protein